MEESLNELFDLVTSSSQKSIESLNRKLALEKYRKILNQTDYQGRTLLNEAIRAKSTLSVQILVHFGVSVNLIDSKGLSPVYCAAKRKDLGLLEFLLNRGADPRPTPLGHATILHILSRIHGETDRIQRLITQVLAAGLPVDHPAHGLTPLHEACLRGISGVAKFLISSGADLNATTGIANETPLHLAARSGSDSLCRSLLRRGANPRAVGRFGMPIDVAAAAKRPDCMRVVAEHLRINSSSRLLKLIKHPEHCMLICHWIEEHGGRDQLTFWLEIEEFRLVDNGILNNRAMNVFHMYLEPSSMFTVHVDELICEETRMTLNSISRCMFDRAQECVFRRLDEQFYSSFISSPVFQIFEKSNDSPLLHQPATELQRKFAQHFNYRRPQLDSPLRQRHHRSEKRKSMFASLGSRQSRRQSRSENDASEWLKAIAVQLKRPTETVDLRNTHFNSIEACQSLSELLRLGHARTLILSYNGIDDLIVSTLVRFVCQSRVESIDLTKNDITDCGTDAILAHLEETPGSLQKIYLTDNRVSSSKEAEVWRALRRNNTIPNYNQWSSGKIPLEMLNILQLEAKNNPEVRKRLDGILQNSQNITEVRKRVLNEQLMKQRAWDQMEARMLDLWSQKAEDSFDSAPMTPKEKPIEVLIAPSQPSVQQSIPYIDQDRPKIPKKRVRHSESVIISSSEQSNRTFNRSATTPAAESLNPSAAVAEAAPVASVKFSYDDYLQSASSSPSVPANRSSVTPTLRGILKPKHNRSNSDPEESPRVPQKPVKVQLGNRESKEIIPRRVVPPPSWQPPNQWPLTEPR